MKFSFFCNQAYLDPRFYESEEGWPSRRWQYDPAIGSMSTEAAFQLAERAEELGFDMVSVSEHHATATTQSPNSALHAAALIQRLKRVRIGVMGPLVSIVNPVRVAEEMAMLDVMCQGRLEALFLRGTPSEFFAYGTNPKETRARTQEAIELIEHALTEPEPFSWEGRYFRFPTVSVWPGATQQSLPVWASGNSRESVIYAAKHKHSLAISFYPEHLVAELAHLYREACAANGWVPRRDQVMYRGFVALADTPEVALEMSERMVAKRQQKNLERAIDAGFQSVGIPSTIGTDADGKNVNADSGVRAGEGFGLGRMLFGGTPDMVVEQIRKFQEETGVGLVDLAFNGGGLTPEEAESSLELFGKYVIPRIRNLSSSESVIEESTNV